MGAVQSLPSHHHTRHGVDSNDYMSSSIDTYSITKPLRCASMCLADVSAAMSRSEKQRRPHLLSRYTSRTLLLRPPNRHDEINHSCESEKHQLPSRPHLRMPSVEDIGIIAKSMDTTTVKSVSLPHSISLPHLPSHVERLQQDQEEETTDESLSSAIELSQQDDKDVASSAGNNEPPKTKPKGFSDLRQRLVRRLSLASRQSKKTTKYLDCHSPATRTIDTGSQSTINCYHNLCADMDLHSLTMDDCVLSEDSSDSGQLSLSSLTDNVNDAATFTTASSSLTLSGPLGSEESEDQAKNSCKVHPAHFRGLLGALESIENNFVSSSVNNESLLVMEDYSHYDELLSADEGIGSDYADGSIVFNEQTAETENEEAVLCRWWPKCVLPVRNMQYMPKLAAMFAVAQSNAACKQCRDKYLEDCDNEQVMFGAGKMNGQHPQPPPPQMMDLWYILSRCPVRPTSSLALSSLKDMAKSCLSEHRLCKSHSAQELSTKGKETNRGFYRIGNQPGGCCSSGYRNRDDDSDSSDSDNDDEDKPSNNELLGLFPSLNGNRNTHLHPRGHRQRQPKRVLSEPMQYILYNSYLRYYGRPNEA